MTGLPNEAVFTLVAARAWAASIFPGINRETFFSEATRSLKADYTDVSQCFLFPTSIINYEFKSMGGGVDIASG